MKYNFTAWKETVGHLIVDGLQQLTIFAKRLMLDFWQGSECPSDVHSILVQWNGPAFGCLVMLWFRLKKQLKSIFYKYKGMFMSEMRWATFNPLSSNPTKWSNTLKQFVGQSRRIVSVCLTILWSCRVKG